MSEFIQYRVRPVTRFIVTRYQQNGDSTRATVGSSDQKGEFDSHDTAHAVAYALAKEEHDRLGYPPGDMRIRYPEHPGIGAGGGDPVVGQVIGHLRGYTTGG